MTRHTPDQPDDDTARRLRDALRAEAAGVEPRPDGLGQIRDKIESRAGIPAQRAPWSRPLAAAAAVVVLAAGTIVVSQVVGDRHNAGDRTPLAGATGTSDPSPSTSAVPSTDPSPEPTPDPQKVYAVTVYFVGKPVKAPRPVLYPQTLTRPVPTDRATIRDAITAMLTTSPADADYRTYWPAGTTVLGLTTKDDGATAVVDLSAAAQDGPSGYGAISAQQLLYTVQAVSPKVKQLELRVAGTPVDNLWGSPLDEPYQAGDPVSTLAQVWIDSPLDGATVPTTFTMSGHAVAIEYAAFWEVYQGGTLVQHGQAHPTPPDNGMIGQGPWQVELTLAPGTYELRASMESGEDGSMTFTDTKTIIVK